MRPIDLGRRCGLFKWIIPTAPVDLASLVVFVVASRFRSLSARAGLVVRLVPSLVFVSMPPRMLSLRLRLVVLRLLCRSVSLLVQLDILIERPAHWQHAVTRGRVVVQSWSCFVFGGVEIQAG